jgi:replicative DNA helicase
LTLLQTMVEVREAWQRWEREDVGTMKVTFQGHWITRAVGSFGVGKMLTVAARTNVGKTHFLLDLARTSTHPAVLVSCEDAAEEVGRRVPHWGPAELGKVFTAFPAYPKLDAVLDAIRAGHAAGARVALVDYAQAITVPGMSGMLAEATKHLCHELKGLTRELGMVLVLASQINRPQPGQALDAEPTIFNLRDGSSLENTSDVVVILHAVDDVTLKAKVGKSKWSKTGAEQLYLREAHGRLVETAAPVVGAAADEWT